MTPFRWTARVYWEDTDGGGVVYYANYLKFFERARTEWLRKAGVSQQALAAEQGIVFTVTSVEVSYRRPARLDDELLVTCEPQRSGAASLSFTQRIHRRVDGDAAARVSGAGELPAAEGELPASGGEGEPCPADGELLAAAAVRVACVDARTFRPQRLPRFVLDVLTDEERA